MIMQPHNADDKRWFRELQREDAALADAAEQYECARAEVHQRRERLSALRLLADKAACQPTPRNSR